MQIYNYLTLINTLQSKFMIIPRYILNTIYQNCAFLVHNNLYIPFFYILSIYFDLKMYNTSSSIVVFRNIITKATIILFIIVNATILSI